MSNTRTTKPGLIIVAFILAAVLLIGLVSGGAARGIPTAGPQPPDRQPFYSPAALNPASPASIVPATAAELAAAMDVPPGDLLAADLMGSDVAGVGVSDSSLGFWFPTAGSSFAILASGLAADASREDDTGSHSTTLGGLDNVQGEDLVRLHMQLKVPSTANCASFDFAFYSEEFPEFVGSSFNDTFTAQLNDATLDIDQFNNVVAPGNFAFDSQENIISVNTVFGVSAPTGTTYDGTTPLLRARTAVVPDATIDVYLSVQDLGDSIYDSAVFLDKFFWSNDPNCESGASVDTDGDGLLDEWETDGITVTVGGVDEYVDLPAMGADPQHKDVFIEIDWMGAPGGGDTHSHAPRAAAIANIVTAFNNAPVDNPDLTTGIHLHVDYGPGSPLTWGTAATWGALSHGAEIPHAQFVSTCTGFNFNWTGVDTIKAANFTAGRAAVFHYNPWVHSLCDTLPGTSGISRNPSGAAFGTGASDFITSLGAWDGSIGTTNQQAGTFMHELGHNLGLRHGGEDHTQWKPNYLSVMNYALQTRGLIIGGTMGHFDYSRYDLANLDENNLDETTGINLPGGLGSTLGTMWFCGLDDLRSDLDASAVDFNCDGDANDSGVAANINQGMSWNNNATLDALTSQNDWINLVYTGGAISQPGASVVLPIETEIIDIDNVQDADIPTFYSVFIPLTEK
jgi:hypothetical protein